MVQLGHDVPTTALGPIVAACAASASNSSRRPGAARSLSSPLACFRRQLLLLGTLHLRANLSGMQLPSTGVKRTRRDGRGEADDGNGTSRLARGSRSMFITHGFRTLGRSLSTSACGSRRRCDCKDFPTSGFHCIAFGAGLAGARADLCRAAAPLRPCLEFGAAAFPGRKSHAEPRS